MYVKKNLSVDYELCIDVSENYCLNRTDEMKPAFFNEFSNLLKTLVLSCGSGDILLVGVFSFHINDINNVPRQKVSELIASFDYEKK